MFELFIGLFVLLAILLMAKVLFWFFVLVFLSPILFVGAAILSISVFFLTVIGVVFFGLLKLLLLPILFLLAIPFAIFS